MTKDLTKIYNQQKQFGQVRLWGCEACKNREDCRDSRPSSECTLAQRLLPAYIEEYSKLSWITPEDLPLVRTLSVLEITLRFLEVNGQQCTKKYLDAAREVRQIRKELLITPQARVHTGKQKKAEEDSLDIFSRG